MLKLKRNVDFEKALYHGFTLKKDFWYGADTENNQLVATSGGECNGMLAVYYLDGEKWEMKWLDIDETDFELENLPKVDASGKLPFAEWLKEEIGITMEEFDECYNGDEFDEEYALYLTDGMPAFARKYL